MKFNGLIAQAVSPITSHSSGSHSPNLPSVPRSMCYNPIGVSSAARSGHERKRHCSKHDDFDNDDDFVPAAGCQCPHRFKRGVSPTSIVKTILHFSCIYPSRCDEICHQHIESERRRSNELRDEYHRGSGSHWPRPTHPWWSRPTWASAPLAKDNNASLDLHERARILQHFPSEPSSLPQPSLFGHHQVVCDRRRKIQ